MTDGPPSTVTLRAVPLEHGATPLADPAVRRTVLATARAIAERTGVELVELSATAESVTATLGAGRLAAVGFAAELRRLTTAWHRARTGAGHLWGEPPPPDAEAEDTWWRHADDENEGD